MLRINSTNENINFQSGLTKKILSQEKNIGVNTQEKIFTENFGIEAHFLNNKSSALANQYCLKIFQELSQKLNISFSLPPAISTYNKSDLVMPNKSWNFCILDTNYVLKEDYPFPGRSIFFRNFEDLTEINEKREKLFDANIASSPHFLAPFIHEWIHSFHLDYIYKTYGYGGNCDYLKNMYPKKQNSVTGSELLKNFSTRTLSPQENEIVYDTLGEYSTLPVNQYLEIFSEALTKFICDSLKNCTLIKNPFEQLQKTPPEFQNIFKKICSFK